MQCDSIHYFTEMLPVDVPHRERDTGTLYYISTTIKKLFNATAVIIGVDLLSSDVVVTPGEIAKVGFLVDKILEIHVNKSP